MFSELALGVWSAAGIGWGLVAWRLVARERNPAAVIPLDGTALFQSLSIFKPLPPLGSNGLQVAAPGLESFISQLDSASELLLGVHEKDTPAIMPWVERLRACHPQARLKVIFRSEPDTLANPKIAWQILLAPHAEGELWLWSDADIVAPPDFLRTARREFAGGGAGMLTFPYVVREIPSAPALFDALYVNVELYPGVLLLQNRGPVDFGLGAGMLFRRDDFLRQVTWPEIGSALADDFVLGQRLKPVQLSRTTLVTVADVSTWRAALLHYLRWSKTVWWSRPVGSAARVITLPLLGWIVYVLFHATSAWAWIGFIAMMQLDVLFAALLCRAIGCPWQGRHLVATEVWTLWRVVVWITCWLPWPVVWRGRTWRRPRVSAGAKIGR